MRRHRVTVAAAVLLTAGVAVPASAGTSGRTAATIVVSGGTLSLTVSSDAGNLGTATNRSGGAVISGRLGQVRVNDARGAAAGSGWVASVVSTAFTSPNGPTIPAGAVSYTAGPIARTGTVTLRANNPRHLQRVTAAVTATAVTGDNTATWNPTVRVTVPSGAAAGVYSATITHSVV